MKTFQILSFLSSLFFLSCSISSIEDFVVGDNFIKDRTGVVMIDTLTLNTSTVKYDSVISNSSGRILVGSNYNAFSGYKNSGSFFQMHFDDEISYTDFVFDSLSLVMNYDTYYSGDTTVNQTFSVYQLQEEMELDNSYLYTTSNFEYNPVPLGSLTFKPVPNSNKEVSIRLSDKLGARFARMIKDKNDTLTSQSLFLKFFNGLVIKAQENKAAAVVGFRTTANSSTSTETTTESMIEMRLYYHISPNPDDLENLYYKFSFVSDGIYFNQISGNSDGSLIEEISESGNELITKQTNNNMLVQSGIQVFSKFKIPYVDNLLWLGQNSAFVGATLRFYPVKGTFSDSGDLPDSLYMYSSDRKNQLTGQILVPGSTSSYVYAVKTIAKEVEETVYYEVDLSSFMDTELKNELETNQSLMIGYGSSDAKKTADQVILGGANSGKYSPVLNVYYYHN